MERRIAELTHSPEVSVGETPFSREKDLYLEKASRPDYQSSSLSDKWADFLKPYDYATDKNDEKIEYFR